MQTLTKTCVKCEKQKPIGNFYFKNKAKGLRGSYCKDCEKDLRENKWNIQATVQKREPKSFPIARTCPNCKLEKPLTEEYFNKKGMTGYQYYCRPCQASPEKGKLMAEVGGNPREIVMKLTEKVEQLLFENSRLKTENEVLRSRNKSMGFTLEELNRIKQHVSVT